MRNVLQNHSGYDRNGRMNRKLPNPWMNGAFSQIQPSELRVGFNVRDYQSPRNSNNVAGSTNNWSQMRKRSNSCTSRDKKPQLPKQVNTSPRNNGRLDFRMPPEQANTCPRYNRLLDFQQRPKRANKPLLDRQIGTVKSPTYDNYSYMRNQNSQSVLNKGGNNQGNYRPLITQSNDRSRDKYEFKSDHSNNTGNKRFSKQNKQHFTSSQSNFVPRYNRNGACSNDSMPAVWAERNENPRANQTSSVRKGSIQTLPSWSSIEPNEASYSNQPTQRANEKFDKPDAAQDISTNAVTPLRYWKVDTFSNANDATISKRKKVTFSCDTEKSSRECCDERNERSNRRKINQNSEWNQNENGFQSDRANNDHYFHGRNEQYPACQSVFVPTFEVYREIWPVNDISRCWTGENSQSTTRASFDLENEVGVENEARNYTNDNANVIRRNRRSSDYFGEDYRSRDHRSSDSLDLHRGRNSRSSRSASLRRSWHNATSQSTMEEKSRLHLRHDAKMNYRNSLDNDGVCDLQNFQGIDGVFKLQNSRGNDGIRDSLNLFDDNGVSNFQSSIDEDGIPNLRNSLDKNRINNFLNRFDNDVFLQNLFDKNGVRNSQNSLDNDGILNSQNLCDKKGISNWQNSLDEYGVRNSQNSLDNDGIRNLQNFCDNKEVSNWQNSLDEYGVRNSQNSLDSDGIRNSQNMCDNKGVSNWQNSLDEYGVRSSQNSLDNEGIRNSPNLCDNKGVSNVQNSFDEYGVRSSQNSLDNYGDRNWQYSPDKDGINNFQNSFDKNEVRNFSNNLNNDGIQNLQSWFDNKGTHNSRNSFNVDAVGHLHHSFDKDEIPDLKYRDSVCNLPNNLNNDGIQNWQCWFDNKGTRNSRNSFNIDGVGHLHNSFDKDEICDFKYRDSVCNSQDTLQKQLGKPVNPQISSRRNSDTGNFKGKKVSDNNAEKLLTSQVLMRDTFDVARATGESANTKKCADVKFGSSGQRIITKVQRKEFHECYDVPDISNGVPKPIEARCENVSARTNPQQAMDENNESVSSFDEFNISEPFDDCLNLAEACGNKIDTIISGVGTSQSDFMKIRNFKEEYKRGVNVSESQISENTDISTNTVAPLISWKGDGLSNVGGAAISTRKFAYFSDKSQSSGLSKKPKYKGNVLRKELPCGPANAYLNMFKKHPVSDEMIPPNTIEEANSILSANHVANSKRKSPFSWENSSYVSKKPKYQKNVIRDGPANAHLNMFKKYPVSEEIVVPNTNDDAKGNNRVTNSKRKMLFSYDLEKSNGGSNESKVAENVNENEIPRGAANWYLNACKKPRVSEEKIVVPGTNVETNIISSDVNYATTSERGIFSNSQKETSVKENVITENSKLEKNIDLNEHSTGKRDFFENIRVNEEKCIVSNTIEETNITVDSQFNSLKNVITNESKSRKKSEFEQNENTNEIPRGVANTNLNMFEKCRVSEEVTLYAAKTNGTNDSHLVLNESQSHEESDLLAGNQRNERLSKPRIYSLPPCISTTVITNTTLKPDCGDRENISKNERIYRENHAKSDCDTEENISRNKRIYRVNDAKIDRVNKENISKNYLIDGERSSQVEDSKCSNTPNEMEGCCASEKGGAAGIAPIGKTFGDIIRNFENSALIEATESQESKDDGKSASIEEIVSNESTNIEDMVLIGRIVSAKMRSDETSALVKNTALSLEQLFKNFFNGVLRTWFRINKQKRRVIRSTHNLISMVALNIKDICNVIPYSDSLIEVLLTFFKSRRQKIFFTAYVVKGILDRVRILVLSLKEELSSGRDDFLLKISELEKKLEEFHDSPVKPMVTPDRKESLIKGKKSDKRDEYYRQYSTDFEPSVNDETAGGLKRDKKRQFLSFSGSPSEYRGFKELKSRLLTGDGKE